MTGIVTVTAAGTGDRLHILAHQITLVAVHAETGRVAVFVNGAGEVFVNETETEILDALALETGL